MGVRPDRLLARVEEALEGTRAVFEAFDKSRIEELEKSGGDPVTAVDLEIDRILRRALPRPNEGWLSEETADGTDRLGCELVWIVDPLDGTREFIDGLPEYCTSIAAVVDGKAVAGGIFNPAADLMISGAIDEGARCNGAEISVPSSPPAELVRVLASRSEWQRGQWNVVEQAGIEVVPMGSVAYKMARVAAGLDPATWTPVPKHEWDVAGGAALLAAVGGRALSDCGEPIEFNQAHPLLTGAIAVPPGFEGNLDLVLDLIRQQQVEG